MIRITSPSNIPISKMAEKALKQEMPPKGGYASINIARNLKTRGPSGFMTFVIGAGMMLGGFLVIKYGNNKRRWNQNLK